MHNYNIFDTRTGVFENDILIQARTASEAATKYLCPASDQKVRLCASLRIGQGIELAK